MFFFSIEDVFFTLSYTPTLAVQSAPEIKPCSSGLREENLGERFNRTLETILHVAAYTNNSFSNRLQFNLMLRYELQLTLYSVGGHADCQSLTLSSNSIS